MKRLIAYISIYTILLLLISACSPMPQEDLSDDSASISIDRNEYIFEAQEDGDYVTVKFQSVLNARSYGYGISSNNVKQFSTAELSFSNGYYTAKVSKDVFSSEPAAAAKALSKSGGRFSLAIFASTSITPSNDWIVLKSVDVALSLDSAPNITVYERGEDSVTLNSRNEAVTGAMTYRISYGEGKTAEFDSSEMPYTITDTGSESFDVKVSHKYTGSALYSNLTQDLTVPKYDPRQADIKIEITDDGSLALSDIPEDKTNNLSSYAIVQSDAEGKLVLISESVTNNLSGSAIIDSSLIGDGFFAGTIRVAFFNNDVNDEETVISGAIDYESELNSLKTNEICGKQSYSVSIPISEKLDLSESDITASGISTATVNKSLKDNILTLSIDAGGLYSKTAYTIDVTFNVPSYGKVTKTIDFTTASFAGNYEWKYNDDNQFAVIVEDAPAGSKFNYYVYTSPADKDYSGEKLRLSPLFENDSEISNTDYNDSKLAAYRWNNRKWNTTSMNPDSVTSITTTINNKDYVSSIVISNAIGMSVTTKTDMRYREKSDGTCYLVFYNEITSGGIAASYLKTNPSPNPDNFENNKYTYALVGKK